MQGMGKEWEGAIARLGRTVFKETGRYSYVALLLLSGAAFGWLGTLMLLVGGSSYYVFGALALFATAALFARRDRRAAYVYGLFLLGPLIWSIAEIGFDGLALEIGRAQVWTPGPNVTLVCRLI